MATPALGGMSEGRRVITAPLWASPRYGTCWEGLPARVHALLGPRPKYTLAGIPSSRSLRCRPAESCRSRMVILTPPPGSWCTDQAVSVAGAGAAALGSSAVTASAPAAAVPAAAVTQA